MAELRTTRTGASVAEFLNRIKDDRLRQDCRAISSLMSEVTGAKPEMWGNAIVGFGEHTLLYADGRELAWMQVAFSPRAHYIALYLMCGLDLLEGLLKEFGPHSRGKSCLYIKRLSDVDLVTLKRLIQTTLRHLKAGKGGPDRRNRENGKAAEASGRASHTAKPAPRRGVGMGDGRKPKSVGEYLAALPADQRAALERLRRQILAAAPGADDCISYGIPAIRLNGRVVVHYGAASQHCSFFPGAVVADFADRLAGFSTSKGTIRFTPDHPIPASLVKALVRAQQARKAPRPRSASPSITAR